MYPSPLPPPPFKKVRKFTPWHGLFFCVLPCLTLLGLGVIGANTPKPAVLAAADHGAVVSATSPVIEATTTAPTTEAPTTEAPTTRRRTATTATPSVAERDAAFYQIMTEYLGRSPDRQILIDLGRQMCATLGETFNGDTMAMLGGIKDGKAKGEFDAFTLREWGFLLGASIAAYCPQYKTTTS